MPGNVEFACTQANKIPAKLSNLLAVSAALPVSVTADSLLMEFGKQSNGIGTKSVG